jgi:hypothetical protein
MAEFHPIYFESLPFIRIPFGYLFTVSYLSAIMRRANQAPASPPRCSLLAAASPRNPCRIRTYAKCVRNPFIIRTYIFSALKVLWNPHLRKNQGGGCPSSARHSSFVTESRSALRDGATESGRSCRRCNRTPPRFAATMRRGLRRQAAWSRAS